MRIRITPAPAGNSCPVSLPNCLLRDHPRPCGEQSNNISERVFLIWITPAPAGNSCPVSLPNCLLRDHPRPCGEQLPCKSAKLPVTGSPPPLRGTVFDHRWSAEKQGITPAPAGNRFGNEKRLIVVKDHPRPCGEQLGRLYLKSIALGSPPPLRGTEKPSF